MHAAPRSRFSLAKTACVIFWFCAAMAIASRAQMFETLVVFDGANGAAPFASPIQGSDGNLYGTTYGGGASGSGGTVFKMTPTGTLTTLHSFCSQPNCTDGDAPLDGLVQGADGNFYGTTALGGPANQNCFDEGCGTVFKMTPTGTVTTLYTFCAQTGCTDGYAPQGIALVQGADGNFYGTAYYGGDSSYWCLGIGCGTVFKVTAQGTLTTLHEFHGNDGAGPDGALVQGTDGNFYGTTTFGGTGCAGTAGCGTIFKMTPQGTVTTLYSFCVQTGCPDGAAPVALLQATDGNFYGTTAALFSGEGQKRDCFGAISCGTVFKITPSGTLATLYSFCSQTNCSDGFAAEALLQATDGNFYGTTYGGGSTACYEGCGTIFKVTSQGTLTTLHEFDGTDDSSAPFGLAQASDGSLYGTASGGGMDSGTIFSLASLNPLQFVAVTPCRLVDTRGADGEFGGPPIQGGHSRSFPIPQQTPCDIPTTAAAYSLNVTVVPITTLGYLTIWPTGEAQPGVSTMNSPDGRIKANAAIVPAGTPSGSVSVYVTDTTNVILDIDGYFALAGTQTYDFYPLTPCRIVDTRNGQDQGMLQAGVERDYAIAGTCGIPTNATAYSFNVTVLPATGGLDYLTVWPQGESQPVVSTLNDNTGTVVANAAIVPAGSNSTTAFYAHSNATNLLVDVDGYFAAPGTGGLSLYPVAPCRVLDTRQSGGSFVDEKTVNVVGSTCAPPSNAAAYVFNATVVPPGPMLYLSLWPDGEQQPTVSTLNAEDGFITSNMAIVPTNNGSIDAFAAALTQLILDISGYFAP